MLKQIIAEMYVDPELLEQLSEEQKENLFGKMREEQLRRWRAKQEELERKERDRPYKRTRRKVGGMTLKASGFGRFREGGVVGLTP